MRDTTQRAKLMLLARKELTVAEMDKMFSTNNSAEIINRLRKQGMSIDTRWETNEKTGKRYGVYFYVPPKKVNRITSRQYARS
jgi:predicted transcriptional regulator